MNAFTQAVATPAGPFTMVWEESAAGTPVVLASGWTDDIGTLLPVIHPTLRPTECESRKSTLLRDAVQAHSEGQFEAIDTVEVRQRSGEFIEHAWEVLRLIPAGAPVTYSEYAAKSGRPVAIRGAASACARNAAALFVPCHRVIRTDGTLGGFRWGLDVKRWLLAHEAAAA